MMGEDIATGEPVVTRLRFGSERLASVVYEEIRNRICMLRYPPGHLLHENRLAQEFGISRTPVRQVLQKLEIEGFVETRSGVGTIVTGVDFAAFRDVYALRLKLAELIGDLLPAGVLNIVNGFGIEAGKPLASSPRIAKIAFTGETSTGRLIMQYASQNLIPVTLELGGKSPNIFFDDVAREDDDYFDKAWKASPCSP